MKTYSYLDDPLAVFGVRDYKQHKTLQRLPDDVMEKVPSLDFYGRRSTGGRVCFRTNASKFTLKMTFHSLSPDIGLSLYACQAAAVYTGNRQAPHFLGLLVPQDYNHKTCERTFEKTSETEDVFIHLPRNEIVDEFSVTVEDDAVMEAPTPYSNIKPMVFYGSSITEAGICCNQANGYNAILSRHLNVDYYNLGFSGSAKGELPIADFINTFDMSAFIYDYDHNADTPEFLAATHEPFFRRIREKHPDLPILMLSRPVIEHNEDSLARRAVIMKTYQNARDAGDKKVWFIDGGTFFGELDRAFCLIDGVHPNDLGFSRMAARIEPTLREMLGLAEN